MLPAKKSRVTDYPVGHVPVYAHILDFGLRFPIDPFIAKIIKPWNICLFQLTSLGWCNLIAYAWTVRYKKFLETLNLFWKTSLDKGRWFGLGEG